MNKLRMNVPSKVHWLLILAFVVSMALTISAPFLPPIVVWPLLNIIAYELAVIGGIILIFAIIWTVGLPEEG